MKIESQHSPTISTSNSVSSMGIAQGAEAQISRMLRDQVYSDKILAVVREYISNANDEHVKYNITRPVEVSLTDKDFRVRDFAKGLSDDDVRNVFGKYGASTKQHTNSLIGGFGIGSKAGHAYSDTFYISSYFEGTKTTYACVLGGTDTVQIGEIHELAQEPTKETGLEIYIDVKNNDASTFDYRIDNFCSVCNFNLVYFLRGEKQDLAKVLKTEKFKGGVIRLVELPKGSNSIYVFGQRTSILMGGVCYKSGYINHYNQLMDNKAILFDFNVGELSVSLSRESFERTEALNVAEKFINVWIEDKKTEELESLRDVKLEDFIEDDFSGDGLGDYQMLRAEFFQFESRKVFSTWNEFKRNLTKVTGEEPEKNKDGKFLMVTLPDVRDTTHWRNKVRDFLFEKDNHYMVRENLFNQLSPADQDLFSVTRAKSLKYPKLSRGGRYKVYRSGRPLGEFNDIETFNEIFGTNYEDDQECRDYAEEFYRTHEFHSEYDIYKYLINCGNKITYSCYNHITACCSTLYQRVRKLGVLNLGDDIINKKLQDFKDRDREISERYNLKLSYFRNTSLMDNDKTREMFDKYPINKLKKLVTASEKIKNRNNLRLKIINGMNYPNNFTRKELRKILNFTE